jgi:hypothetical protein
MSEHSPPQPRSVFHDGRRFPVQRMVFHEAERVAEYITGPASRPQRGPDDTSSWFVLTDAHGEPAGASLWPSLEEALAEPAKDQA